MSSFPDRAPAQGLDARLDQLQKMEAVGRLAGGIAHDFNNLLTVILGFTDLLLDRSQDDQSQELLGHIRRAGERAAELTRQLLTFSRQQPARPAAVDLNQLLREEGALIASLLGERIELELRPAAPLWPAWVDPGQLHQVLVNLVVNARDAMPRGGKLVIETANVPATMVRAEDHRRSPYVMLAVIDTGAGMSEEIQARLFEPFFTTKPPGKGTGLGLATAYGIIQQAGGFIRVSSRLGIGSKFRVFLPPAQQENQVALPATSAPTARSGAETLLIVEDEPDLRNLAVQVLRRRGYAVLEARHGHEALRCASRHCGPIDLLLTDVVMPEMSGPALATHLTAYRPGLRVLYMSGYSHSAVTGDGELLPGAALLPKPFTPASLEEEVRRILCG